MRLYTVRPSLAARLVDAGIEVQRTVSIFDERKHAWSFDASREALAIAAAFYEEVGKGMPDAYIRAELMLEEEARKGGAAE